MKSGAWEQLQEALRRRTRVGLVRNPRPSIGIVGGWSVKTTEVGGEEHAYDLGKKVKGKNRHLLVDTEGLVVKARVHSASVFDCGWIKPLMELVVGERFLQPFHLRLDTGYNGKWKVRD